MNKVLYIVIPAYNEEANIERLVQDWYPVIERYHGGGKSRMVIINDGSKDNTWQLLQEAKKQYPLLEALTKTNGGHGDTVLYGYNYAIAQGADYVFQTDSDGQTNPAEFPAFYQLMDQYDAVIGERTGRQDGAGRVMIENVVRLLLKIIFGVSVPDANAPFRLMKAEMLKKYIPMMPEHYNLPNIIITMFFAYYKENITFRHVTFKPRQGGENSINYKKIFQIGMQAVKDFIYIRKQMKDKNKNR